MDHDTFNKLDELKVGIVMAKMVFSIDLTPQPCRVHPASSQKWLIAVGKKFRSLLK